MMNGCGHGMIALLDKFLLRLDVYPVNLTHAAGCHLLTVSFALLKLS